MQFVTFRLADSLPESKLSKWREERDVWLEKHPKPWKPHQSAEYQRKFTEKLNHWLDQGHGSCLLKNPDHRSKLAEVLMHSRDEQVRHEAWVIMPNHVHLLFSPIKPLSHLIKSWKGVSANKIGLGSIWRKNYWDTIVRDSDHYRSVIRYIRKNPKHLPPNTYTLWESPNARAIPTDPT